jgi:chromosome segregation ATPase
MPDNESHTSSETIRRSNPVPVWLTLVISLFAILFVFLGISHFRANQELTVFRQETTTQLQTLTSTNETLEAQVTDLQGDMQAATEKLGLTEKQLAQARATARKLREEQQAAAEQLNAQLTEQRNQLTEVSGNVTTVRDGLAQTQGNLTETRSKLESVAGDLGVQSGLIARNHDELVELRRRGERDYTEFNLARSKEYSRVGMVSVRVNKVDLKRNKYTATLLVNDKVIEKKDKTLLEPVQFYLPGTRHMLEIVVFDMQKNRIGGY